VDTVERLRFITAKPQRIFRRAIAAAVAMAILFIAWRYTVAGRGEDRAGEAH
jgi:hypothetical protein